MDASELRFAAVIGVEVKGETWSCIEIPDSAAWFGTGKSVRVDVTIDDVWLENLGTLPTGAGGHMISVNAKVQKRLGKGIGDEVQVKLLRR